MKINKIPLILCALGAGLLAITLFCMQKPQACLAVGNNIQQIDSFTQAADALNAADKNTLVLFDVDDTLIEPASMLFRPQTIENEAYRPWIKELVTTVYVSSNKPEAENYYGSIWKVQEALLLIEPEIVKTIVTMQNRGVTVMALTALRTGAYFTIPSLPEWRFNQLKDLGINFSRANFPDMVFNELPKGDDGNYPVLYHGILCTSTSSKGAVLGAFLDRTNWKPDLVIFLDDSMKRVEQVAAEMRKRGIPFQGYQYMGAEFLPGELDKEVAEFQLKYLVEHEEWLSEDEARSLMKQQKQLAYSY